jgi:chemotaxis protein MotA
MQAGPLIGIGFALFAILFGNFLEGGQIKAILGGPAMLIVLGGTMGAVMVQYPFSTLTAALRAAGGTFKKSKLDGSKLVDELVEYANRARRDGILALEKVTPSDPFLAKALAMAIDGADSNAIRDTMETTLGQQEEHGEDAAKVFEAMGGYSPTVGIIGAVLGLIKVMSNLSDVGAVGEGIAAAFVATIYGVMIANIFFLPIAGRIKLGLREEITLREMTLIGVLAIQEGTNPKLIRDRLVEFVHTGDAKHKAAPAAQPARAEA